MKLLRNLCLHFSRQDGQDGKKPKGNYVNKATKITKTKRRKYGMNETIGLMIISYRRNGRSLCKRSFSATFRSGEMRCSSSSIGSGISRRCISASGATAAARFSLFALAMGTPTATVIADVNSHFKIPCMDVISLN